MTIPLFMKSPLPPLGCESYRLCQRGAISPTLEKGDRGGFYQQFFFHKVQFSKKGLRRQGIL